MGLFSDLFGGSESSQRSFVDPVQQAYLQGLYRRGAVAQQGASAQLPQFQAQGQQFLGALGGAGSQLDQFTGPGFAQQQIGAVQSLLNRNLTENLLPAIGSQAQLTGGFGGGRQGVAEGIALRGTQEALSNTSADILSQDLLRRQQAAQAQGALSSAGAQAGLSFLPQQLNLGLSPLLSLAQILGPPTVLGQGSSETRPNIFKSLFPGGLF